MDAAKSPSMLFYRGQAERRNSPFADK